MSCLFESLASYLKIDAALLRAEICNYLQSDPVMYDDVKVSYLLDDANTPSDLQEYVNAMRRPETWGSALEIETFCKLYKCSVDVEILGGNVISFGVEYHCRSFTVKLAWDGGHYSLKSS